MRRVYCILTILFLVPHASLLSQDLGRKTGFGIRLLGELTFNQIGSFYQQTDNNLRYYNVPVNHYLGSQFGVFYKLYFDKSKMFIESQLTGLYLGQKEEKVRFFANFLNDYEDIILNDDMNEWGGSLSMVYGCNFPIGQNFSIDAFTGPEVCCAFSCKNEENKNLLDWHYNRWQMRWELGTGVNYRHVGVQVYGSYDITKKSKQVNTRNFTLSLGLGYKF